MNELNINDCRLCVSEFAIEMESQLRKNDHKPGWLADDPADLLRRIDDEIEEFKNAYWNSNGAENRENNLKKEAADILNFVMMVCDLTSQNPVGDKQ